MSGEYGAGLLTLSPDHTSFVAYGPTGRELWRTPAVNGLCTPAALAGSPYALCEQATEPGEAPVHLMRLGPAGPVDMATLPKKSLALGAAAGRPLFLEPQTAKTVYDAGYERPHSALLRVAPETGHKTGHETGARTDATTDATTGERADVTTGKIERIPLAHPLTGAATLVNGIVYFVRSDGTVTAVSADSGRQLWQKSTDMENLSAPAVSSARHQVYFCNRFGRLLALDTRTGTESWRTVPNN